MTPLLGHLVELMLDFKYVINSMCVRLLLIFGYDVLSDCQSLIIHGISIRYVQHCQVMLERRVCELAHYFFHFSRNTAPVYDEFSLNYVPHLCLIILKKSSEQQ